MPPSNSGIELTAKCPPLLGMYRLNKINLEIDQTRYLIEWDTPMLFFVPPGPHRVSAGLKGIAMNGPMRTLDFTVEAGQIVELTYTLKLISGFNPGKLDITGHRSAPGATPPPASTSSSACSNCGTPLQADTRFCPRCGKPVAS